MTVHFAATMDEVVDTQLRTLRRSRTARRWKWSASLSTALVAGVVTYSIIPESDDIKLILGIIVAVGGIVAYPLLHSKIISERTRKYIREFLGSDGPFPVVVEFTPDFISVRQFENEYRFSWQNITTINDTADAIEFPERHGGMAVVRKRAFPNIDDAMNFTRLAQGYIDQYREKDVAAYAS